MYLYGASGHGKVVAEAAEAAGISISGFIDDNSEIKQILDFNVISEIPSDSNELVITIGNNGSRKKIAERLNEFHFPTIIHPFSSVSKTANVDSGTVVFSGVSVNSEAKIGKHCILNTNCSVDHDCRIGDFVHISPNAALAGNVSVGEGAQIGIGACVIQGVSIGNWATIGAGAVVIEDIPDFAVAVGNPAKVIKYKENTI